MMKKKLVPITLRTVINISSFVWTNEPPGRFPLVQYKSAFFFWGGGTFVETIAIKWQKWPDFKRISCPVQFLYSRKTGNPQYHHYLRKIYIYTHFIRLKKSPVRNKFIRYWIGQWLFFFDADKLVVISCTDWFSRSLQCFSKWRTAHTNVF